FRSSARRKRAEACSSASRAASSRSRGSVTGILLTLRWGNRSGFEDEIGKRTEAAGTAFAFVKLEVARCAVLKARGHQRLLPGCFDAPHQFPEPVHLADERGVLALHAPPLRTHPLKTSRIPLIVRRSLSHFHPPSQALP